MRPREFIKLVGGVAAWPVAAHAQELTMSVVLRRIAACKASPIPVSPRKLIGGEFLATVIEHQTLVINTLRTARSSGRPARQILRRTRPRRCRSGCHIDARPLHQGPRTPHP